mgnify:CR=1 FL=1
MCGCDQKSKGIQEEPGGIEYIYLTAAWAAQRSLVEHAMRKGCRLCIGLACMDTGTEVCYGNMLLFDQTVLEGFQTRNEKSSQDTNGMDMNGIDNQPKW